MPHDRIDLSGTGQKIEVGRVKQHIGRRSEEKELRVQMTPLTTGCQAEGLWGALASLCTAGARAMIRFLE